MKANRAFEYPLAPHVRRHGPIGYVDYESYRDWLRDEFSFRCAFCLQREQWKVRIGSFHVDHYAPQAIDPGKACVYDNLLYACAACNLKKSDLSVPNPSTIAFGTCVRVNRDGTIEALDSTGELLIDLLRLDDADNTRFRKLLLNTLASLEKHDQDSFIEWMKYPEDLPDLSRPRKKPPEGNSQPEGVTESWFAKRERGELPKTY